MGGRRRRRSRWIACTSASTSRSTGASSRRSDDVMMVWRAAGVARRPSRSGDDAGAALAPAAAPCIERAAGGGRPRSLLAICTAPPLAPCSPIELSHWVIACSGQDKGAFEAACQSVPSQQQDALEDERRQTVSVCRATLPALPPTPDLLLDEAAWPDSSPTPCRPRAPCSRLLPRARCAAGAMSGACTACWQSNGPGGERDPGLSAGSLLLLARSPALNPCPPCRLDAPPPAPPCA